MKNQDYLSTDPARTILGRTFIILLLLVGLAWGHSVSVQASRGTIETIDRVSPIFIR